MVSHPDKLKEALLFRTLRLGIDEFLQKIVRVSTQTFQIFEWSVPRQSGHF